MNTFQKMALCAVAAASLMGCANMNERDRNTAIGAGAGAIGGSILTGGSGIGTVGGAVIGGVIAREVDRK